MSLVPYVHLDTALAGRPRDAEIPLDPADMHHLVRVLRLRPGAEVVVADGQGGQADAVLGEVTVRLRENTVAVPPPAPRLVVVQAVPKARKLDEVIRQVVELGADLVIPVAAERSVSQRDAPRARRAGERWSALARAAAEQSRRPWRTEVAPLASVEEAASRLQDDEVALLVAEPGSPSLPAVLGELPPRPAGVAVAIGPEGGWSAGELERWHDAGARAVGLGPSVLRTEHAAAAAIAVIAATLGRWG